MCSGEKMKRLSGLVVGTRATLSMGRVLLWVFVGLAVYFWLGRPAADFPPSLEVALISALGYNLGGKAVNQFSRRAPGGGSDDDNDKN